MISGIIFFPPITDSAGVTVDGFKLIEGTNDVALKWLIDKTLTFKKNNITHRGTLLIAPLDSFVFVV